MDSLKICFLLSLSFVMILGCQPPDCDRKDCGTCGNACCTLDIYIKESTLNLYGQLVQHLKAGGPDSRYTYINGYDMRADNVTADFILQGVHTTQQNHYNDTLDFTIIPTKNVYSLIRSFSISQVATAYCDAGQNYKNLIYFVKSLGVDYLEVVAYGCPQR